eukprot:gene11804-13027_t
MTDGIPNHIMPQSDYNPVEAKFCASLFWLVFHATEDGDFDNIPAEITCPTERNEEAGFFVRSPVVSFLCDGTIYMKVASQLLNSDSEIVSFWDVIQLLANAGFYVIDFNDEAVTEERLAEQAPFSMESHLALMDTLIVAFVNSSVTIQQIVDAVRRFGTFNPSKEQPFDYEDAFLLWLNKISTTNNITVAKRKQSAVTDAVSGTNAEPSRRFRFKRDQVIERAPKVFPKLDDFQRDIADGKSLLSLIVFYCPDALDIDLIKLSGKLNDEEIITNVDLFRELCAQHICTSIFALRTEDIVYKYAELKNNILALFCEMFLEVEVERRDQGREGAGLGSDVAVGEDWKTNEAATVAKGRSEVVENSLNANRQNESRFPDSADTNTRFYPRKQQETTEKVKQRTGVKTTGYASGDEIDMSIEDKLQRLKMLSAGGSKVAESLDSLPPRPTQSTAKAATKSRQPLLSKRSKKQLANIGDGKKSLSNEDLSGLELEDFDLKRSHSLSSVTERANYAIDPKRSIRAWEGGTSSPDTSRSQKSQKISLDFKPDAAPYRPHRSSDLYTMEDHTSSHLNVENRSWRQQDNQDNEYRLEDYDSESTKQEEALASPRDGERLAGDSFALSTNSRHATARGGGSIEGSLHNHRTTRADDVRESAGSTSSEEMRRFRDEIRATSHGEIYEGEERVDNGAELEAGFVEPQLEDDDMFGFGGFKKPMQPPMQQSICNYGVSPRPNRIMVNSSSGTFAKGLHGDHDDELSTIAESSEPSTPTVYSFESRLSTEDDSRNSLLDTSEEAVTVSDTGESTLTSHAFVSPTPSGNEGASLGVSSSAKMTSLNRVLSPNYQRNSHLAAKPPALPRSSYTILNTDLSLDSAIAAGLPIIEDEEKAAEFTDGTPYFEHTSAQDLDPNLEQELGRVNGNLGSEHGSDADDVQIHLPAISRSSSSGISADGVREEEAAISEEEADGRPGIAVYSSLSEHTAGGSSPTNLDGARHVQHVEDAVGDGDGGEEEATPLRDQAGAATDVNMQESRKDVEEDEVDAAGNVPVKRSTFLSLDFDEDEQMSTSALAICLEPVEAEKRPAEEKQQNSSPTRSRHSWSYMEVEVKKENPSNIFGNSDQRNADQDTSSSTTPSRSNHTIESMPNRQLNRDKKATTSWQQISRDDGSSFLQGIKKPHKDLTHCLTKVEDGPVMNWAEYAKLKNVDTSESEVLTAIFIAGFHIYSVETYKIRSAENATASAMFTLGDVADILDNALDMGISIVDALHKMAETGEKGRMTKEECMSNLTDIPSAGVKSRPKREASSRSRPAGVVGFDQIEVTGMPVSKDQKLVGEHCGDSDGVHATWSFNVAGDLSARSDEYSKARMLDNRAENIIADNGGPSPLKIFSHSINAGTRESRSDEDDIIEGDDDYYDTPLKNYTSKRWSTANALNLEDDSLCPADKDFELDSPVCNLDKTGFDAVMRETNIESMGSHASQIDKDVLYSKDLDTWSSSKRQRCNTYSIGLTPPGAAEEKGLPIIDALDNLCQVADQWLTEHRAGSDGAHEKFIPGSGFHSSGSSSWDGSEGDITPSASYLVEKNVQDIENEAENVLQSLRVISDANCSLKSSNKEIQNNENEWIFSIDKEDGSVQIVAGEGSSLKRFSSGEIDIDCSASQAVEEKIADIGSQANIVLESFAKLTNLMNSGNVSSGMISGSSVAASTVPASSKDYDASVKSLKTEFQIVQDVMYKVDDSFNGEAVEHGRGEEDKNVNDGQAVRRRSSEGSSSSYCHTLPIIEESYAKSQDMLLNENNIENKLQARISRPGTYVICKEEDRTSEEHIVDAACSKRSTFVLHKDMDVVEKRDQVSCSAINSRGIEELFTTVVAPCTEQSLLSSFYDHVQCDDKGRDSSSLDNRSNEHNLMIDTEDRRITKTRVPRPGTYVLEEPTVQVEDVRDTKFDVSLDSNFEIERKYSDGRQDCSSISDGVLENNEVNQHIEMEDQKRSRTRPRVQRPGTYVLEKQLMRVQDVKELESLATSDSNLEAGNQCSDEGIHVLVLASETVENLNADQSSGMGDRECTRPRLPRPGTYVLDSEFVQGRKAKEDEISISSDSSSNRAEVGNKLPSRFVSDDKIFVSANDCIKSTAISDVICEAQEDVSIIIQPFSEFRTVSNTRYSSVTGESRNIISDGSDKTRNTESTEAVINESVACRAEKSTDDFGGSVREHLAMEDEISSSDVNSFRNDPPGHAKAVERFPCTEALAKEDRVYDSTGFDDRLKLVGSEPVIKEADRILFSHKEAKHSDDAINESIVHSTFVSVESNDCTAPPAHVYLLRTDEDTPGGDIIRTNRPFDCSPNNDDNRDAAVHDLAARPVEDADEMVEHSKASKSPRSLSTEQYESAVIEETVTDYVVFVSDKAISGDKGDDHGKASDELGDSVVVPFMMHPLQDSCDDGGDRADEKRRRQDSFLQEQSDKTVSLDNTKRKDSSEIEGDANHGEVVEDHFSDTVADRSPQDFEARFVAPAGDDNHSDEEQQGTREEESRRKALALKFVIGLNEIEEKIKSPPEHVKQRLSASKQRPKKSDRPGTFVLNSPVFEPQMHEGIPLAWSSGVSTSDAINGGNVGDVKMPDSKTDGTESSKIGRNSEKEDVTARFKGRLNTNVHLDVRSGLPSPSDEVFKVPKKGAKRPGTFVIDPAGEPNDGTTKDITSDKVKEIANNNNNDTMRKITSDCDTTTEISINKDITKAITNDGSTNREFASSKDTTKKTANRKKMLKANKIAQASKAEPVRKETKKERLEKFRRSFESQKLGIFIDLHSNDVELTNDDVDRNIGENTRVVGSGKMEGAQKDFWQGETCVEGTCDVLERASDDVSGVKEARCEESADILIENCKDVNGNGEKSSWLVSPGTEQDVVQKISALAYKEKDSDVEDEIGQSSVEDALKLSVLLKDTQIVAEEKQDSQSHEKDIIKVAVDVKGFGFEGLNDVWTVSNPQGAQSNEEHERIQDTHGNQAVFENEQSSQDITEMPQGVDVIVNDAQGSHTEVKNDGLMIRVSGNDSNEPLRRSEYFVLEHSEATNSPRQLKKLKEDTRKSTNHMENINASDDSSEVGLARKGTFVLSDDESTEEANNDCSEHADVEAETPHDYEVVEYGGVQTDVTSSSESIEEICLNDTAIVVNTLLPKRAEMLRDNGPLNVDDDDTNFSRNENEAKSESRLGNELTVRNVDEEEVKHLRAGMENSEDAKTFKKIDLSPSSTLDQADFPKASLERHLSEPGVLPRSDTSQLDAEQTQPCYDVNDNETLSVTSINRQLSDNSALKQNQTESLSETILTSGTLSASLPALDANFMRNPFQLSGPRKRHGAMGHRPMSQVVTSGERPNLLQKLQKLRTIMSKSLTKLNAMGEDDSEIFTRVDEQRGKEETFVRRRATSTGNSEDIAEEPVDFGLKSFAGLSKRLEATQNLTAGNTDKSLGNLSVAENKSGTNSSAKFTDPVKDIETTQGVTRDSVVGSMEEPTTNKAYETFDITFERDSSLGLSDDYYKKARALASLKLRESPRRESETSAQLNPRERFDAVLAGDGDKRKAKRSTYVIAHDDANVTYSAQGDRQQVTSFSGENMTTKSVDALDTTINDASYVVRQRDSLVSNGRSDRKDQGKRSTYVICAAGSEPSKGSGDGKADSPIIPGNHPVTSEVPRPRTRVGEDAVNSSQMQRSTYVISRVDDVTAVPPTRGHHSSTKHHEHARVNDNGNNRKSQPQHRSPLTDITKASRKETKSRVHASAKHARTLRHERKDESAGRSPREPLAPRLAILKMQLEERRRHIEEEKKRMVEQWNEERARVGQQAFWFAVGNKDSKTEGGEQDSNAKESGADSTKKPGLMFFPFSDDNDPKTLHKKSPPTRPESPPNECSTPVTRAAPRSKQERFPSHEGNYTVHDNRIDSQDSNYTVNFNRIGSQTILESSTVNEQGITYVVERHEDGSIVTVDDKGDQVFYEDYASIPTFVKRALTCGSSDALASGKHQSPRRNDSRKQARPENPARQQAEDTEHHENLVHQPGRHSHRTAWNDPVKLSTRDFPPSVIKGMESADVKSESLVPESETHFYYEESLGNVYRRSSDEGLADHLLHDRRAMKLVSEELQSEPAAREIGGDRGLRYPADQALSPDSWDDASERRGAPIHQTPDQLTEVGLSKDQATPRTGEDHSRHKFKEPQDGHDEYAIAADVSHVEETTPRKISPRDDAMRNTGVEIESPAELTPDQLKKRERFLQNRVKRQQEEKAKKEAELEKRKRKEEKMRERKAASEKKEREDQRKRKLKEEEEARRRHEEGARRRHEEETRRRRHGEDEEEQRRQGGEQPWRLGRNYPTGEDERPAQHHKTPRSHFSGNNNGSHGNIRQATNEAFNQASPTQWTLTEYRGPPVYVKPSGKSNRQIMFNAITHCCLSGEVNKEAKEKSLQVLSQSNATHFFALFREGLKFRGLYSYPHEEDEAHKIYGVGPKIISNQMVEKLFKYSSGGKSFSQIPAKSLSIQVDGIMIKKGCWQSSKATSLPSKTDSNLKKGQTSYSSRSEMLKKGSPKAARR